MVNDGGGASEEALQEERMLYVWDREEEGGTLTAWLRVCSLFLASVLLSATTDTPSESAKGGVGCFAQLFLSIQRGPLRTAKPPEEPIERSNAHTQHTFIWRAGKEQQVMDGLGSIQVYKPQPLRCAENMRYTISRLRATVVL